MQKTFSQSVLTLTLTISLCLSVFLLAPAANVSAAPIVVNDRVITTWFECYGLLQSNECAPETPVYSDSQYGPMVSAGDPITDCPNIPALNTFASVVDVYTPAQFNTALANFGPNKAIRIMDGDRGTGWTDTDGLTIPASASGSILFPAYIITETVHGAELHGGYFDIEASHVVVAGIKRTGGSGGVIDGEGVRIACGYYDHAGSAPFADIYVKENATGKNGDFVIDNNTFRDFQKNGITVFQDQYQLGVCPECTNKGGHIHHNDVSTHTNGTLTGQYYWIYAGLGYGPNLNLADWTADPKDAMGLIVENNKVTWKSGSKYQPIDIKSSYNVVRNNCFDKARPMDVRHGNDNLVHGNIYRNAEALNGGRVEGYRNIIARNFVSYSYPSQAMELWQSRDSTASNRAAFQPEWLHYGTQQSIIQGNVYNNANIGVKVFAHTGDSPPSQYASIPTGNKIRDNKIFHAGSYTQFSGSSTVSEVQFIAANPAYDASSFVVASGLKSDVPCGTVGHVTLPAVTITTFPQSPGGVFNVPMPGWGQ